MGPCLRVVLAVTLFVFFAAFFSAAEGFQRFHLCRVSAMPGFEKYDLDVIACECLCLSCWLLQVTEYLDERLSCTWVELPCSELSGDP